MRAYSRRHRLSLGEVAQGVTEDPTRHPELTTPDPR